MNSQSVRKAVVASGGGAGKYRGKPCAVDGCDCRTLMETTEYCALHYQQLVGTPKLKAYLKDTRAAARKRA